MNIYQHQGYRHLLTVEQSALSSRIRFAVDAIGTTIPDDEIPALISGLQNYMSRKAREQFKTARNG
jgi:hypothetical protein